MSKLSRSVRIEAPAERVFAYVDDIRNLAEKLLAARREQQAAPDPIEKLETQFLLEAADLPRQRRLGDVQHLRGLRNGAVLGARDT